jgi:hypothetical protein
MATCKILPHYTSDHKPISLALSPSLVLGPILFRFCPIWTGQDGFLNLVHNTWNEPVSGSPFYVWEEKLRRLKFNLKAWAKKLGSPMDERKRIQKALEIHQSILEESPVTQDLLNHESELQRKYHKICREEEIYWRVKSRVLWLQYEDKNTTFFHKQAQARKIYNSISEIQMQYQVIKDFKGIKEVAHSFFKNLYSAPDMEPVAPNSYPISEIPALVNDDDNRLLNRPISIIEIKKSIFDMDLDKVPRMDGFTARLYTSCWDIIKKDLYRMVMKSQNCTKLGGSTNSSFLALIPKEKGAKNFNRFRPISLCNTGYKIITKIMANRLKRILPKLISKNQGGFVRGRQILDNIILVQEAIHTSCKKKDKGMVIKMDLANAFDRVKHDFLFAVMRNFGFNQKFIEWVKACISAPWIAPLINGHPAKFFQASRGLRQGCPLSPVLYVIQASVLSFQLHICLQNRSLLGIRVVPKVKDVNHAQFADDTLLLGDANLKTTRKFKS